MKPHRMWCSKIVEFVAIVWLSVILQQGQCQSQVQKVSNEITGSESSVGVASVQTSVSNSNNNSPASAPVNNGHFREYGSSFYYPAQKPMILNRDSYADAANDFGYNPGSQQAHTGHHHSSSHSYVPSTEYGVVEGHDDGDEGGAFGGLGGLGGLGGIAGILGIKGIKGLGLLGILKAGLPLFALLLPALLLLPLVFLFLPVPVITIPSNPNIGRSANTVGGFRFGDMGAKMTQLARSVLDSEKCVERMSCELSRVSRGSLLDKTLKRVFSKFENHFPKSIQRMARAYMDQSSYCNKKYACYLVDENSISKSL